MKSSWHQITLIETRFDGTAYEKTLCVSAVDEAWAIRYFWSDYWHGLTKAEKGEIRGVEITAITRVTKRLESTTKRLSKAASASG